MAKVVKDKGAEHYFLSIELVPHEEKPKKKRAPPVQKSVIGLFSTIFSSRCFIIPEADANFSVCDLSCILQEFPQIQKEFQTLTGAVQLVIEEVGY